MRTTVELPEGSEGVLREMARRLDLSDDQAFESFLRVVLVWMGLSASSSADEDVMTKADYLVARELSERYGIVKTLPIRSTPDVLGGDVRVRNTRIPVWLLVAHKKWGESDSEILAQYPSLNAADLTAAWDFDTANSERVDAERRANEEAA